MNLPTVPAPLQDASDPGSVATRPTNGCAAGVISAIGLAARDAAKEVRALCVNLRDLGRRFKRSVRHAERPPTRGYWAKHCRCRACRKAWQARQS